jgi:hypothetical protein
MLTASFFPARDPFALTGGIVTGWQDSAEHQRAKVKELGIN